ncbi:unnamed protein product [Phyllotreta striolata]|uniref:Protein FAM161A n=1 Tax=Phyllotreta striolata TaxID=444603 RepID=A0A9N9TPZ9_PHYSR|nr:unnamed protein product [Phyllotreta striolata]
MNNHTSSVYNNSLLKVPRNPIVGQPLPLYEQNCKYHLEERVGRSGFSEELQEMARKKYLDKETTESFVEFFNDIPEYHQVGHLSNAEFYAELEKLKLKKRAFEDSLHKEIKFDPKNTEAIECFKMEKLKSKTKKKAMSKPFCATPVNKSFSRILTPDIDSEFSDKEDIRERKKSTLKPYNKTLRPILTPDIDSEFSDKDVSIKPPSRRSVRIETPSDKFSYNGTPEPHFRTKSRTTNLKSNENLSDWENIGPSNPENVGNSTDWTKTTDFNEPLSDWKLMRSMASNPRGESKHKVELSKPQKPSDQWEETKSVPKALLRRHYSSDEIKLAAASQELKSNYSAEDLKSDDHLNRNWFSQDLKNDTNVEENRPKSGLKDRKACGNITDWEDLSIENLNTLCNSPEPLQTRSAPATPTKSKSTTKWNNGGITIPKPFQMTVRDEENKIVEELYLKMKKPKEEKPEMFKAHDIPIESLIPLFDKLVSDQQRRSFIAKEKRKAALRAQVKPFSFTKRDEEIQELTRELSKSSPNLYTDPPLKIKKFKAKPIPRNLFSNYIYRKMHEDEYYRFCTSKTSASILTRGYFYRSLQKKVRAEELLKAASLPPSMAKREKTKPKFDTCPRSYSVLRGDKPIRKSKSVPDYKIYHDKYEKELEDLKNDFISTSPRPFKLKTSKRGKRNLRLSSASSKSSSSKMTVSPSLNTSSINTSNLAAVLRIQSARNKLETEMEKRLQEAQLREELRWREKLFRKKPIWQTLAYSHEEDLAMRLRLRRDEERLRSEEHKMRMQLMYGRVNQQPTLFERQSQMKYPKTKEELKHQLRMIYGKPLKVGKRERANTPPGNEFNEENCQSETGESQESKEKECLDEKEKCECSCDETDDYKY